VNFPEARTTLEAEGDALEAERDLAPSSPSASLLGDIRGRVAEAVAASGPEQVKELLAAVVSSVVVESRASIQPSFRRARCSYSGTFAEAKGTL
jgi:hypothetical protein